MSKSNSRLTEMDARDAVYAVADGMAGFIERDWECSKEDNTTLHLWWDKIEEAIQKWEDVADDGK